jgi:branched-chain amino acid transport system substrate-binding protein
MKTQVVGRALFAAALAASFTLSGASHAQAPAAKAPAKAAPAAAKKPAPPTGEPIIFGMDEDSTGPGAVNARVSGRAVRSAVDYINENGGILGRPVKLIVENDESDATKSPAVTRKLIEQGANVLFFATAGSAIIQAKPVVKEAKVISFGTFTITAAVTSPPDNEYVFSMGNANADVTTLLCQGWNAAGIKRVAVFGDGSATVDTILKGFIPALQACVEVVAQERAPVDTNDVTAQITRVRNAKPDAMLTIANGGQFEVLVWQTAKRLMPKVQRFSTSSLGNQPDAWKLASPAGLEGLIYTGSATVANPETRKVDAYLRAKHKEFVAISAFDAWSWDAVMLAKVAIEKAGGVSDKEKLLAALTSISGYKASYGQPGFTLSYTATKHVASDGLCGMNFSVFGRDNKPSPQLWKVFQPKC